MRTSWLRRRAALVAVALCGTALATTTVPATSGQELVPGVVDLAVTLGSSPATVSPPGELVLINVRVENKGALRSSGTVEIEIPAGSTPREDLTSDDCVIDDLVATCSFDAVAERFFEIVSHTPTTPDTYVHKADVASDDPGLQGLEYGVGNHAEVSTKVEAPNGLIAAGLVEENESLTLVVGDGREYILEVPEGVPGVIAMIRAESGGVRLCGTGPCDDGFHTDFVQHPYFKADDEDNPLITRKTFGPQPPCHGFGGRCSDIYWAKKPDELTLKKMDYCPGASGGEIGSGVADPSPCLNQKYRSGGNIWFDVRMLSTDPMELPPLRL